VATFGGGASFFILVLIVMHFLKKFEESKAMNAVLSGIRPATVGLIGSAVIFSCGNIHFQWFPESTG
jgi:chromate transporter